MQKIGVLIPTFNRRAYVEKALTSAIDQSYGKLDIIVIDNGSADGTAEFMASISDPRVRYIVNEKNIGMIGSINKGIDFFSDKVEWCTVLGDDDLLDANFILNLLQAIEKFSAKSIVHSHRILIDQQGNKISEAGLSPPEESVLDFLKKRSFSKRQTYLTGVLFNRRMFNEIGGYPAFSTGLTTDDAFIFALALKDRLLFEQSARVFIRVHEHAESMSVTDGAAQIGTIKAFDAYCRRVAAGPRPVTGLDMQAFDRVLQRYVKVLCSGYWLRAYHSILDRTNNDNRERELSHLNALVMNDRYLFSLRIRLTVFLGRLIRVYPESGKLYRYLWGKMEGLVLLIRYWLP